MKLFRHYKDKYYRLLGMVKHSETLEDLVYYDCLYENDLGREWVRPKDLFFGETEVNGRRVTRFARVELRYEVIEGRVLAWLDNFEVGTASFSSLNKPTTQVLDLAVSPNFRRLGVGTEILTELARLAKHNGARQLSAIVPAKKSEWMIFLLKAGWQLELPASSETVGFSLTL